MTIPRYQALQRHWRRHPRPEWLIAGYLGYKPPPVSRDMSTYMSRDASREMSRDMSRPTPATSLGQSALRAMARVPPPTGALQTLFRGLGGGSTRKVVVLA